MGLLGKANAKSDAGSIDLQSLDIQAFINRFYQENPLFHCLLLGPESGEKYNFLEIAAISGSYGIECVCLPNGNYLILMPGSLDIDLFSHRFSKSSGSTVILQFSTDSPSSAIEKLTNNN
jgi:hypothetical protein